MRRRSDDAAERGGCAQNQVESLLFFFRCSNPDAVRIDSRLHCTDTAIHSKLGGQQWRRRERKQRRRRKRQSVGRRSSRRRDRSSASHVSKVASHGPANVEGGSTISRDGAGSGGRQGASAGRWCKLRGRVYSMRRQRRKTGNRNRDLAKARGLVPQRSRRRPRCLGITSRNFNRRCGANPRRRFSLW